MFAARSQTKQEPLVISGGDFRIKHRLCATLLLEQRLCCALRRLRSPTFSPKNDFGAPKRLFLYLRVRVFETKPTLRSKIMANSCALNRMAQSE